MNKITPQEKRIITFAYIMQDFSFVSGDIPGESVYCCNECFENTTFKNPALFAASKKYIIQKCKPCTHLKTRPYVEPSTGVRECVDCCLRYHMVKDVKYFSCLCKLKTKRDEYTLYKALQEEGFKLSREEYALPNNKHKVDIKAELGGKIFWIEIDGGSHLSKKQTNLDRDFDEEFKKADLQDQFLRRIHVDGLRNEDILEIIVKNLKKEAVGDTKPDFRRNP